MVSGAKMIGTGAVFADEVIVGTIEPLAPGTWSTRVLLRTGRHSGLKFVSRTSYEARP